MYNRKKEPFREEAFDSMDGPIAEVKSNLKYLRLLARDFPTQAAAASEVIRLEATLKLPKGTEHYISDLHGEDEAFIHILNSASGVIREKVDTVLGDSVPAETRAELSTLLLDYFGRVVFVGDQVTTMETLDSSILTRHFGYSGYTVKKVNANY